MKRIFLIFREDITYYPPIYAIIRVLLDLNYKVFVIGEYSDLEQKKFLEENGVSFWQPYIVNRNENQIFRIIRLNIWRRKVEKFINENANGDDFIWIFQAETFILFNKLVNRFKVIAHPLEFNNPKINWKYRLQYPFLKFDKLFSKAFKIVCCEYNRAHIFKGMYELDKLPLVLPNKPYIQDFKSIEKKLSREIEEKLDKFKSKKIILYQGVFQSRERRLEEFCDAINLLGDDYVLVAMGKGSKLFDDLKEKYESDKIFFLPFVNPPYHLMITKLSYIGVLSYYPRKDSMASIINPLYCAPNKIFEYSMFGKPMISNDIPGLNYIFREYNCGKCVDYPMTPIAIKDVIMEIDNNYAKYSEGSFNYYNSINLREIVETILA